MILSFLPSREEKPRQKGMSMVMDKGLSIGEAQNMVEAAGHLIDFVKLGFGTSMVSKNVKEKVKFYRNNGIKVFLGGTLFEAFLIRNNLDGYMTLLDTFGVNAVEISDGSIAMNHDEKCGHISRFALNYTVLSEVGAKEADVVVDPLEWARDMEAELLAGSTYVIGEARESGTVGIYGKTGSANGNLVNHILEKIPADRIIWEAPLKCQQVWFIKLLGSEVNLGNIAPADIIPLETLRLGLRGDTFFDFLPEEMKKFKLV